MKKIILTVLFTLLTQTAFADLHGTHSRANGLLRFLAQEQGIRNLALQSIISNRCNRHAPRSEKAPCREAVKKMVQILDFDIIFPENGGLNPNRNGWTPSAFVFVAFKKHFLALLSEARTGAFLYDLNQQLWAHISGGKDQPNIWDLAKHHYKTDYLAARALATLFQDSSPKKLHLGWLELSRTRGNNNFNSNKELLDRVIDTINLILDSSEDNYRALFYPAEVQRNLNRNIYHFYVPMFLSMSLERTGQSKTSSYTAALMLTLTYEFVTSARDFRYFYDDPRTIESLHKVKDIFGGYCGANIGVRGMNFNKSFTVIREAFLRSTEDAVELLLRH